MWLFYREINNCILLYLKKYLKFLRHKGLFVFFFSPQVVYLWGKILCAQDTYLFLLWTPSQGSHFMENIDFHLT